MNIVLHIDPHHNYQVLEMAIGPTGTKHYTVDAADIRHNVPQINPRIDYMVFSDAMYANQIIEVS